MIKAKVCVCKSENKGNRVEYSTFFSWRLTDIIGCNKIDGKGKTYVVQVWCKVRAEHKSSLKVQLRSSAKTSALAFIDGTNSVTRNQVS